MPTAKPRYTFTDTGELETLLDAAQRRWPEIDDRKLLLLRLAQEGADVLGLDPRRRAAEERGARLREVLARIPELVDEDALLDDRAWA